MRAFNASPAFLFFCMFLFPIKNIYVTYSTTSNVQVQRGKSDIHDFPNGGEVVSLQRLYMSVSKNRGTPKWMVYNGKLNKFDAVRVPPFLETPV